MDGGQRSGRGAHMEGEREVYTQSFLPSPSSSLFFFLTEDDEESSWLEEDDRRDNSSCKS